MKKLTYADLTPELLKELSAYTTAEEIICACREKELEISELGAAKLMEQFEKAKELMGKNVESISGGERGYFGTRKMFQPFMVHADLTSEDCWYDVDGDGIPNDPNCPYYGLGIPHES